MRMLKTQQAHAPSDAEELMQLLDEAAANKATEPPPTSDPPADPPMEPAAYAPYEPPPDLPLEPPGDLPADPSAPPDPPVEPAAYGPLIRLPIQLESHPADRGRYR